MKGLSQSIGPTGTGRIVGSLPGGVEVCEPGSVVNTRVGMYESKEPGTETSGTGILVNVSVGLGVKTGTVGRMNISVGLGVVTGRGCGVGIGVGRGVGIDVGRRVGGSVFISSKKSFTNTNLPLS